MGQRIFIPFQQDPAEACCDLEYTTNDVLGPLIGVSLNRMHPRLSAVEISSCGATCCHGLRAGFQLRDLVG